MRVLRVPATPGRARSSCDAQIGGHGEIHHIHPGAGVHGIQCAGLSVHCVWGARYDLRLDERAIALDDEVFVIAAPKCHARGQFRVGATGCALAICYPPGAAMRLLTELPLEHRAASEHLREQAGELWLAEHIRVRDRSTELQLRFIVRNIDEGLDDPLWYEGQTHYLLRRLLQSELRSLGESEQCPLGRPSTRRALLRRIGRITDLIHSEYERRLTLADFAAAANLSAFHMLRSFKLLHGTTPYKFLQRRRLSAGIRLLCSTDDSFESIAERVGFADRRSFYRLAVRQFGTHLRGLRWRATTGACDPSDALSMHINDGTALSLRA